MKLQISFDNTDLVQALAVAKHVEPWCDLLEIGALTLAAYGVQAIKEFRAQFPKKALVADIKIIDRGLEITELIANAGADYLTVMGGTNKHVLHAVSKTAQQASIKVILDLIDTASLGQIAMDASGYNVNTILMHKPHDDDESLEFLDQWSLVRGNTKLPIFIAAKINRTNVKKIVDLQPDGIVVGSAITKAADPAKEAQFFFELCKQKTEPSKNNHA